MFILRRLLLLPNFLLILNALQAQDLHYSQFYHNPTHLSPALTGIFRGDLRAAASYRSQWKSVPVSYQTFSVTVDRKILKRDKNYWSVGFQLQHDRAGDAALKWTQAGVLTSVTQALGERHALSVGAGLAFVQRSFDISNLTFKNQWSGDLFDASLPTGENFDQNSGLAPTLSAGLNWHYEPADTRTRFDAGLGVFHLNRPDISFIDDSGKGLPMRLCSMLSGVVQTGEFTDIVAFGSSQHMGKAREILIGGGLRRMVTNDLALQLTIASRLGDAIIPAFQAAWLDWTVGLSYDFNISDFDVATNGRGGFEIAAVYRPLPVQPLKNFKSCPLF